ncbi:hypothetical protein [Streptomyces sp. YU58]|uniref:hypothetical protein n=1 Tax=Streptomyces sp. SX92 TaxID=3158972 RepID=UPI0027B90556|nr:hypothetical protein [Streptomyces coralus]WLW52815.1 hypothetical protein QU709_16090 [Streptomyces coralus]
MRNILKRLSVTSVAAVAICAATVTNANAASGGGSCSVSGAKGGMTFTNWSSSYVDISGYISDTAADGHHVGIRFRSMDNDWVTDWSWRLNYSGSGSTISFDTHASTEAGRLDAIGAQVAVREGNTIVRSCTFWA